MVAELNNRQWSPKEIQDLQEFLNHSQFQVLVRLLRSQALCSELKVLVALLDGNHIDVQEVSRARDIGEMITLLEAIRSGKYENESEFEYTDKMIAGTIL